MSKRQALQDSSLAKSRALILCSMVFTKFYIILRAFTEGTLWECALIDRIPWERALHIECRGIVAFPPVGLDVGSCIPTWALQDKSAIGL
jgi:hypothetical protein